MGDLINGFSPSCIFLLPMLGRTRQWYPRFRDCFYEDGLIAIRTRVGGKNRNQGYGEEEIYKDKYYVRTYDDDFDSNYGVYLFRCPDEWRKDFDNVINGKFKDTSDEYHDLIYSFYPSLKQSGFLDNVFYGGGDDSKRSL